MVFVNLNFELSQPKLAHPHEKKRIQPSIEYRHTKRFVRWTVLTLLVFTTGCNRQKLLQEIGEFDNAVNAGTTTIAAYYTNLNEQEYDLYFQLLELDPTYEVGDKIEYKYKDDKGREMVVSFDSPLKKPPFPLKSIQTRINTLKQLTAYSKALASLASDDSPAKFQGNIKVLNDRLISLRESFEKLQSDRNNPDLTANKYLTPLGTTIGIFGKLYLQERQWSEIQKSIIAAEAPVNIILDAVAEDLDRYVDPLQDLGSEERYTTLVVYYNLQRLKLKPEERVAMLAKIREYKSAYDFTALYKPSIVPRQIKEVHMALVETAKSDGAPQDVAQLKAELDLFKDDVEQLKDAIGQLVGRKENN